MGMRQLQVEMQSLGRRPVNRVQNDMETSSLPRRSKMEKNRKPETLSQPTTGISDEEKNLLNPSPEIEAATSYQIPGFVYALGFYFVMNYFFG